MFGMIKMEMRRKSYLPELTVIISTNDALGDKILIHFFSSCIIKMVKNQQGILKPIENRQNEIMIENTKASIVFTVLFPSEDKLQSFQKEIKKGGCF